MNAAEENALIKKHADKWRKDNGHKDFLEEAEKEKAELNESYKESVRQANERKAKYPQRRPSYEKRYGGMMTGPELHRASYTATNRGPSKPKKGPYEI